MRIAVWYNLPTGGAKRALFYHVRGLAQRGHIIQAWCPPSADQSFLRLDQIVDEHVVPFSTGVRAPRNRLARLWAGYSNVLDVIRMMDGHCRQVGEQVRDREFDLLLASSCMFLGVSPIARHVDLPSAIYLQEPYRRLYEAMPELPWIALSEEADKASMGERVADIFRVWGMRIQARSERTNAQAFDRILVNSFFSRESVQRAYGLESQVCYLGVDTDLFKPARCARGNFVMGIGGVFTTKGVDRAVRALGTIAREKRPDLIWVGDFAVAEYKDQMQALADSLGVNLIFKIGVTDTELVSLLNRATAMVYTSRLEPFGFAPLEANACETPVVAIAEGGVRETIQNNVNGILVDEDDPALIGEAIQRLMEQPELARRLGMDGRKLVLENWTWDAALDRLEMRLYALKSR